MSFYFLDTPELSTFCELSKRQVTSYLLDYVTKEYKSIIDCPVTLTQKNTKRPSMNHYPTTVTPMRKRSSLPSPPLSDEYTHKQQREVEIENTPPLLQTNKPSSSSSSHQKVPMSLCYFIESVLKKSNIDTGTLLISLSYVRRLRLKLYNTSKGMECTHHRIFVATLLIASKYTHDASIKNKHWVDYSSNLFSKTEINLMEKQLLELLDYNLEIPIKDFESIANDVAQLHWRYQEPRDSAYASKRNSCQIYNESIPSPPHINK